MRWMNDGDHTFHMEYQLISRRPKLVQPLPSEFDLASETDVPRDLGPRQSTRVSRPLDRYGSFHSLSTTLTSIPIPLNYSEAIKYECWVKNFRHYKRIILETLFLIHLMSRL